MLWVAFWCRLFVTLGGFGVGSWGVGCLMSYKISSALRCYSILVRAGRVCGIYFDGHCIVVEDTGYRLLYALIFCVKFCWLLSGITTCGGICMIRADLKSKEGCFVSEIVE